MLLIVGSTASAAPVQYEKEHRLGPGDAVSISVYGEPDLTIKVTVDKTGTVDYPFLGQVIVGGRTTEELKSSIDRGLRGDYLINPEVTVTILEYRKFFISGEVRKPGSYPYTPGMSVIKAVVQAGGFTNRAAKDKIIIQREGSSEEHRVHHDAQVRPGDILTIKESIF